MFVDNKNMMWGALTNFLVLYASLHLVGSKEVEPKEEANGCYVEHAETDGSNFTTKDQVNTRKECWSFCYENLPRCKQYTFYKNEKSCVLKDSYMTRYIEREDAVSGLLECEDPDPVTYSEGWCIQPEASCDGSYISRDKVDHSEFPDLNHLASECQKRCSKKAECTNFTATIDAKSSPPNHACNYITKSDKIMSGPASCGLIKEPPPARPGKPCHWQGVKVDGHTLGNPLKAYTFGMCWHHCHKTDGCSKYVWDILGFICTLLSSKGTQKATLDKNYMTGSPTCSGCHLHGFKYESCIVDKIYTTTYWDKEAAARGCMHFCKSFRHACDQWYITSNGASKGTRTCYGKKGCKGIKEDKNTIMGTAIC